MYYWNFSGARLYGENCIALSRTPGKKMELNKCLENDPSEHPVKKRKQSTFLLEHARSYTSNTSLHALQYFGESGLYMVERAFWFVMVLSCVTCCALLIRNLWTKWDQSPVIVSFAETMTPVWKVPFPAITICPKNKVQKSKYNFSHEYFRYINEELSHNETEKLEDIAVLCEEDFEARNSRNITNSTMVENILSVAPSIRVVMESCSWREKQMDCGNLFTRVLTNKGLCYTFNSLSADEIFRMENIQQEFNYSEESEPTKGWTPENGYTSKDTRDVYPRRGRNFGAGYDLVVYLAEKIHNLSPVCDGPVRGFEVLLHNPVEKPRLSQYYIEVRPGEEKKVAIKLNMETTSESLRTYDPAVRQCFFPTERYLRFFNVYTQKNCEMECRTNYTYAMCGCVSFYMPYNDSNRICSAKKENCVSEAKEALADSLLEDVDALAETKDEQTKQFDKQAKLDQIARSCRCLPTCTSVSYEADTSSSKIDLSSYIKAAKDFMVENDTETYSELKMSRISFFFKDSQFISMRRSELYGPTDFLANCGGLLGLFHGFSVLSLVEIIYYMTLRLFCEIRRTRIFKSNDKSY